MSNYTSKLLEIYNQIEEIAIENNKTILDIKKQFDDIVTDKLAIQIAKEYKETGIATEVYRKYGISQKYFQKLLNKVQKVTPKKHRKVKEFIYDTLDKHDITYTEYLKIAQYFEKQDLDTEKALNKLIQLRTPKKKAVKKTRKKTKK